MFRVAAIESACEGVKTFRLVPLDRKPVTPFKPGAHIVVTIKDAATGLQGTRAYTLTSSPLDTQGYEITIACGDRSQGVSKFFHTGVRPGRVVTVAAPVQGFGLAEPARHALLVAGGIGITPIVSLARQLELAGNAFEIFYSARSRQAMPFLDELLAMRHACPTVVTTLAPAMARLNFNELLERAPPDSHVYACGPAGMIQDVVAAAKALDWDESRVHFESFGAVSSPDDAAFDVVLARSGHEICVPPGQTILDALIAAGVAVDYDCRHGSCGRCTQRILQGQPEHKDALYGSAPQQDEWVRICVSRSRSARLVLDL